MPVFTDLDPECSEEAFLGALIHVAQLLGYLVHHDRPSRRGDGERWETAVQGDKGFPDVVLIHTRTGATILAELKAKGGRTSPEQDRWLDAGKAGPTPTFLWHPRDWVSILAVLEEGARARPHDPVSEGPKALTPARASDDPDYRHAEQTVTAWWEWFKERSGGSPPTALKFVACVKIVQQLYKAGWSERDVKQALADPKRPTLSVGAMEVSRSRRGGGAQATNTMGLDEWRRRNQGRPLTEREPKPAAPVVDDGVIDTTAREA